MAEAFLRLSQDDQREVLEIVREKTQRPTLLLEFGQERQPGLRHAGDAQRRQMGTRSDGRDPSGTNRKRGNPLLSGSKQAAYLIKIPFSNRFRLELRSPPLFSDTCSAFP